MIYIFVGENGLIRDKEAQDFVSSFISSHGDMAFETYAAEDLDDLRFGEIITSVPFLSERKLIKIRSALKSKSLTKELVKNLNRISDSTDILLVEDKLVKNSDINKIIKLSDVRYFSSLSEYELAKWALEYVALNGGKITKEDINYLISRVGSNQDFLYFELQKLLAYSPQINKESINKLTTLSANSKVFDLMDSILAGDLKRSIDLYREQKSQGQETQSLLGMITWQLTTLATVRAARNLSPTEIASKTGLNPFVIKKALPLSNKLSKQQIIEMFEVTVEADISTKNYSTKDELIIENLLIKLIKIINS